ncbi:MULTISPECIES: hypothetical protein [Aeromonas]|uniref:HEAT repeat domain-containing protein n=1 Tax=Aeromonas sanarellii TaxID=633415 RepID=A0ABS4B9N0_9GAMM|nr:MULTISPECIES: hypothetical protein [Aeromonas]ELA9381862.1 hypothetical protein [Aeromonas hydrophila]MBP0603426.1 hypothetical protein [Aeromonas sanarellii]
MNAYILRCKPHGFNREQDFLEGRISIGWPGVGNLDNKSREEVSELLGQKYGDLSQISVSMVDLFVNMPVGSIVLTPSIKDKAQVHIFKTSSAYQYDKSADNDERGNPHFINVTHVKTVSRANLPPAVIRSLSGARKTLSRISQYFDLLDEYISSDFDAESVVTYAVSEGKTEAFNVLYELLNSEDENVRLKAAIAILEHA